MFSVLFASCAYWNVCVNQKENTGSRKRDGHLRRSVGGHIFGRFRSARISEIESDPAFQFHRATVGQKKTKVARAELCFPHFRSNWTELIDAVLHAIWIIRNNRVDTVYNRFHWARQRNRHRFKSCWPTNFRCSADFGEKIMRASLLFHSRSI